MIQVFISVSVEQTIYSRTILDTITDISVFEFLINRLKNNSLINLHILTSNQEQDDIIEDLSKKCGVFILRDKDYDRASCIIKCMKKELETYFVLISANYPLINIEKIYELVNEHTLGNYDYSCNEYQESVVWGMGCDIFSIPFLINLDNRYLDEYKINELSYFILQNKDKYKVNCRTENKNKLNYKLACESTTDVKNVRELLAEVGDIKNDYIISYMKKNAEKYNNSIKKVINENSVDKLILHMKKADTIISSNGMDKSYPVSIELTLTNQCNLKCIYCSDYNLRKKQGILESLDLDTLQKLFDDLSRGGTKGVVLEGGGEPTLYKEFDKVVKYAKEVGLAVGLITNGTIRLSEEILKEFEWIRVSLDASTSMEYKNLKGMKFFEKVIHNIAYFAEHCKTIGVGYVVTNQNCSEIEALIRLMRSLGVAYVQLRPVVDCPELYPKGIKLSHLKKYQSSSFTVNIEGMHENSKTGNSHLPCRANGLTSVISGDGSVYLCGRLNIYDWIKPIGNIKYQRFEEIWYSEERKKQWEMVQDPQFCTKTCPQCRISKFNKFINQIENISTKNFI